jgi:glycosyltransferase involved in cell wall biosynthesis
MPQQPLLYTKPAVTTVHDLNLLRITSNDDMGPLELRIKRIIFAALLWIVARRTKHILANSQFTKDDLAHTMHVNPQKITVTYPSAEKTALQPTPVTSLQGKNYIMYVGRAEPYKNNRGLILVHQKLLVNNPDLWLVIVGSKDVLREADMRWVSEQRYKNIAFMGFVPDDQLAWLYQNCRAYVFPSFMEGFGMPGLEAMVYGAPVAASNLTSIPEVLGDAAVYFDPKKTEEMERVVGDLINNNARRAELGRKGLAQAAKYSWRRMAEQTLAVYDDVLTTVKK